ncbi:DUF6777 domain-containing protein [Streptomyces sp. ODS05-4]|uniref:DUF6777 domain-containing protein n=1 Tax=Streptomyces sp. ODS05-4 TaxID=2944939 RepID=UPI00210BF373|nr:DUF6777 domain-containing protein [Streptomyces sp. ODS05-4]
MPAAYPLAAALIVTGCGDGGGDAGAGPQISAGAQKVRLLPAGEPGPDPFTASTARPSPGLPSPAAADGAGAKAQSARSVPGSTPGLYGGTRSVPSCDTERQAALLTEDDTKARAFAQAAGVTPAGLSVWVRGLTPVLLRADVRVTGHGYRDGAADPYQAVLQTGTAVLVDRYGSPRVRCAGGNPLRTAVDARGTAEHEGEAWPAFHPGRTLLVNPTARPLGALVIVNVLSGTWVERPIGTSGSQDVQPADPPPYKPGERDLTEAGAAPTPAPRESAPAEPSGPPAPPTGNEPAAPPDGSDAGEQGERQPENAAPDTPEPADCPTDPGEGLPVPAGCPTPPLPPGPPEPAEPQDLYGPPELYGPDGGDLGPADGGGDPAPGGGADAGGPDAGGPDAGGPDAGGAGDGPVFDME